MDRHMLFPAQVYVQRIPIIDIRLDPFEQFDRNPCAHGNLGRLPQTEYHMIEERLRQLFGPELAAVGIFRYDVIYRIQCRIGYGLDYPFRVERELGTQPIPLPYTGPFPEPIQNPLDVVIVLRGQDLHRTAMVLASLRQRDVAIIDEPLVRDLLYDDGFAAAAYDLLR